MDISDTTLNSYGLKSSTVDLYELCNKYDIVFLQETLLFKHELNLLSKVHPDFEGMGISAIDDTCNILSGRPYGGLAILIRRKIRPICDFIFYDDTRIMGIQIKNRDECLYFVNVYLPYQCPDNYDLYVEYLGKLSAIIEDYESSKVGIIGDFNAAVGTTFEGELLEVCTHHELIISDYEHFGRNSSQFTFVSDAHSTTSWLDHIICSFNLFTILSDLCILDKLPSSDHLPIGCNLCFDLDTCMSTPSVSDSCDVKLPTMKCQWSKASDVEIEYYRMKSYISLDTIFIPDVVKCVNNNCSSKEHQGQLDSYITSISDTLDLTSKQTIPTSKIKCPSEYIEITGRLDALEGRIVALEDRPPPSVPSDELACNFVVYGLAESDDENVSDKVNNLLLGQLKIENIRVAEAVRKDKFNNNTCGVVVAKCSNIDDKNKVMEAKSKLRDTEHFSHISIVHDKPKWQRQHEANLRLVVKTLGTNKLFIRGNRVCTTNDQHGWQNNGGRERGQNPIRGRGQGRGHGRGRGGPRGRRGQGPNRNVER